MKKSPLSQAFDREMTESRLTHFEKEFPEVAKKLLRYEWIIAHMDIVTETADTLRVEFRVNKRNSPLTTADAVAAVEDLMRKEGRLL